jgi:heme-degrading monooxygenase HmoA
LHALILRVTIHDRERAEQFLRERVVPGASQAPGFVGGYWMNVGGNQGASVVVFESEEAAQSAQESWPDAPSEIVTIDAVQMGEVIAHA